MKNMKAMFAAGVLASVSFAVAAPGDPLGGEFRVGDDPAAFDGSPATATTRSGDYLFVSSGPGSAGNGVYAQAHYGSGAERWPAMRIDAGNGSSAYPGVAMSRYGYFMAAWISYGQDGDGYGVYSRLFRTDGSPITDEFRVNTATVGDQGAPGYGPAVATDLYGGRYVVAWTAAELAGGYGVYAQRYDSSGAAVDGEFKVNLLPSPGPATVSVDMSDNGEFMIAWEGKTIGSTNNDIVARRYDASGAPLGDEFKVNTTGASPRGSPSVAAAHGGGIAVVWQGSGMDPDAGEIYAQRYDAGGAAIGPELRVNATVAGYQRRPKAAMDHDGDLTVVWESLDQDGSDFGVYGQRFLPDGAAAGGEFQVNQSTAGAQLLGDVAMDADGDVIVAWSSEGQGNFARRYRGPADVDLAVDLQDQDDPAEAGGDLIYDVTVTNLHPYTGIDGEGFATGVRVDVDLPAGATFNSVAAGDWRCSGAAPVSCERDDGLWPGGTVGFVLYAIAPAASGSAIATATVTAYQDDGVATNNVDVETTTLGDVTPDAFAFTDVTGVEPSTTQTSDAIVVSDIDQPVPVTVSDGAYSLNGQPFTSADGVAVAGDSIQVQHVSAPNLDASVHTVLTVGNGNDTFTSTTRAQDTTPDALAFPDQLGVLRNTEVISDAVVVTGITDDTPIRVENWIPGQGGSAYSIDGGPFTTEQGLINNGQSLRIRHTSASCFSCEMLTRVSLGGWYTMFRSQTQDQDTTPDALAFPDKTGVLRNTVVTSDVITVTGITDDTPINIADWMPAGSEYSIDGGPFTSETNLIDNGQTLQVRHTSASCFTCSTETRLQFSGGPTVTFRSMTQDQDTTPDPFSFVDQTGVARGVPATSNTVVITGIDDGAPVSVMGGEYSIDSAPFTSAPGTVNSGQTVQLRHVTATGFSGTVDTTLTVGGYSDTFSTTTEASDTTPDPFNFFDRTEVERSLLVYSQALISGLNDAAPLSITVGEYSLDGAPYTSAPGTITNGQYLMVRHTSSAEFETTVETVVTIGGVSSSFTSTTLARDTTPEAFAFASRVDVAPNIEQTSDDAVIGGLNDAAPISVAGGAYSIDGGPFTTEPGSIGNGQSVRVRHMSAGSFSTEVQTTLTVGGVSAVFSSTTLAQDVVPGAFAFQDRFDVARNAPQVSDPVVISGINDAAPVSVTGGTYSIDGGPFTSAPGSVGNGQSVVVAHTSSADFSAAVGTTLTVGGVSATFTTTTLARDVTPDQFRFGDQAFVPRSTLITSDSITVTGINDGAPISVTGGAYSIDGGLFTTADGTVTDGQSVRVQHTSSAEFFALTDTILTIGGVSDRFSSETEPRDDTPDGFSFEDVSGVATGTVQTSAAVTIGGVNDATAVTVSGGQYSINGGSFTSADGTVSSGDQVRVRHTSASVPATAVSTTLTVGGVSDTFTSTTGAADTTPDGFTFTDVSGVRRSSRVTSNSVAVSGVNAAVAITVSGGDAAYSKNGGAFTSAPGTVVAGDSVRVRVTAASTVSTTTNVVVTIGGVSDTWSVTTGAK